jgi:hypothetical protein
VTDVAPQEAMAPWVVDAAQRIAQLEYERDEYKKLVRLLQEENARLKRGLVGQKRNACPRTIRSCRSPF